MRPRGKAADRLEKALREARQWIPLDGLDAEDLLAKIDEALAEPQP